MGNEEAHDHHTKDRKMKKAKLKTPREARTFAQICKLPRDNVDSGDFWIAIDEQTVTVAHQQTGAPAISKTTIPRRQFEALIDWYNTGSKRAKP